MTGPVIAAAAAPTVDLSRLDDVPPLTHGNHRDVSDGACVMEAVSFVAGEPWSAHPACACPVPTILLVTWNDNLPDDQRDALLRPLVPLLVGTRSTPEVERRRSLMAADWLVREYTPAWLRLAGLTVQADAMAGLPEITDIAQFPGLMPLLKSVREDATVVLDAAWTAGVAAGAGVAFRAAVGDAAGEAVRASAGDPARAAAGNAARAAARATDDALYDAWDDAMDAAWAAAGAAAWNASWDAAGAAAFVAAANAAARAARAALRPTCEALQQSALALVHRMIGVAA